MRTNAIIYVLAAGFAVFGVLEFVKARKLGKELTNTEMELSDVKNELEETKDKLEEVSDKLGSLTDDINDKVDNIQSYASDLESSIDALLREIRWANCDACYNVIWDIERKAKNVESDFESLQAEINN